MKKSKPILTTRTLRILIIILIIAGLVFLITGFVFLIIYFFSLLSCCRSISWIDVSSVLIAFGLGFITTVFSLVQIRNHKADVASNQNQELLNIYELYKKTSCSYDYINTVKILQITDNSLQTRIDELYLHFLNGKSEDSELDFDKMWNDIKQQYFINNIEKKQNKLIEEYDPENPTIKSEKFKDVFVRVMLDLEEISFRLSKLTIGFEDIIYDEYISPFIVLSFKLFFPYIEYYNLEKDAQYFYYFVRDLKFVESEDNKNERNQQKK